MRKLFLYGGTAIGVLMLIPALPKAAEIELGQGVVCNTQSQMERWSKFW